MLNISRRCVPFTPFVRELAGATVALVTATGVYEAGQEPFPAADAGDATYRVIRGDADNRYLRISHRHYDHSEADRDANIVFPLETLRELAGEGFIRAVSDRHYSYGFTTRLRELYGKVFPEIAGAIERSRTKLVLLTAGCRETCHRSVGRMAREIEARGVPTLVITASPAATESVRPPRAMTFEGAAIGRVVGRAGEREVHRQVVRAALEMFAQDTPPGRVVVRQLARVGEGEHSS